MKEERNDIKELLFNKCHSKLDLESHLFKKQKAEQMLKRVQHDLMDGNSETLNQFQGNSVNVRAFTLIELLVVVLIIGILTAIALPQYQKAVEKTKAMTMLPRLNNLSQAQHLLWLANNTYTNKPWDLAVEDLASTTSEHYYGCLYYKLLNGERIGLCHGSGAVCISNSLIYFCKYQPSTSGDLYCYARSSSPVALQICKNLGSNNATNGTCVFAEDAAQCKGGKISL